jgi:hypothetical protein
MLEALGDMWRLPGDGRCVTTNGIVRPNGRAVMGKGSALSAKQNYRNIDLTLGKMLVAEGNHVHRLSAEPLILSFPVKNHWRDKADMELIMRSCDELMAMVDTLSAAREKDGKDPLKRILLPRPGCGAGSLLWTDVQPHIAPLLDDRIVVVSY